MNAEKYTQKSLEAVKAAQELTIQNQNQQIEQAHLLAGAAAAGRRTCSAAAEKNGRYGRKPGRLPSAESWRSCPRVTGSGREADKFYVSRAVDGQALNQAEKHRRRHEGRLRFRRASAARADRQRPDETRSRSFSAPTTSPRRPACRPCRRCAAISASRPISPEDTYEALCTNTAPIW